MRRSARLSADYDAAFQDARERVQDWLHEAGALNKIVMPFSAQ